MIPPLAPTFEAALRDVGADGPRFRIAAARRLADPPEDLRDRAVRALATLATDVEGAVREAAYEAQGELGVAEALPQLVEAFDDPHRGARQAAVLAAGRVDSQKSEPAIATLLVDPRAEMRFSALWTLSRFGSLSAGHIVPLLRDPDEEVRVLAVDCLAELEATDRVEEVSALLQDPSDRARFAAASALASLGDGRGVDLLRAALRSDARAFEAAIKLGDLRDETSVPALANVTRQRLRSPILRAAAARGLVMMGDPRGEAVIRKIVRSWRIEARQYAVELVGELGLVSLVPDLGRALERAKRHDLRPYETALERLAPGSAEARALLASLRAADHSA